MKLYFFNMYFLKAFKINLLLVHGAGVDLWEEWGDVGDGDPVPGAP